MSDSITESSTRLEAARAAIVSFGDGAAAAAKPGGLQNPSGARRSA